MDLLGPHNSVWKLEGPLVLTELQEHCNSLHVTLYFAPTGLTRSTLCRFLCFSCLCVYLLIGRLLLFLFDLQVNSEKAVQGQGIERPDLNPHTASLVAGTMSHLWENLLSPGNSSGVEKESVDNATLIYLCL